jgi:DNA adenine methylase
MTGKKRIIIIKNKKNTTTNEQQENSSSNYILEKTNKKGKKSKNKEEKITLSKPILKWVGGKTQIIDKIISQFPEQINNYREIFLGGGSVLFAILKYIELGKIKVDGNIYAYDLNEPLIYVYKNIQKRPNGLYTEIKKYIDDYNNILDNIEEKQDNDNNEELEQDNDNSDNKKIINRKPTNIDEAKLSKENYYYWIRNNFNNLEPKEKQSLKGSAMFIFLNKTCFRGLYRMGPKGFNVPFGHYKNPEIINENHLKEISKLIKNVIFEVADFTESINNYKENDFLYFDPPYAPENTKSFVGYTNSGFKLEKHNELFELCKKLNNNNIKFMMSNADVDLVKDNFTSEDYNIEVIECKRAINSKKPNAKTNEIIIKNY